MRVFHIVIVASMVLLAAPAYAQAPVQRYGEPDKEKTNSELEIERKAEAAYKRSLNSVPDARAADPWGGVRSEPAAKAAPAKRKSGTPN